MRTGLNEIIKRLRVVSNLAVEESESIERLYGIDQGMSMTSPEATAILFEPKPCRGALHGFLKGLPPNVRSAILVLMYGGRDGDEDMVRAIDRLKGIWQSKDRTIDAIMEKFPRMEYIDKGLERLGYDKLDWFLAKFPGD